ncbi:MAG TPA: XdhC family protein, partial [Variovorax sp.]
MTDASPASILAQALRWKDDGAAVALATIARTWPTSPLRAGSQMAVGQHGAHFGSVFGPAIDAQVAQAAQAMLAAGVARSMQVVVDDATATAAGLACGGAMEIRLEAVRDGSGGQLAVLRATLAAVRERRSVVLCTWLADGRRELLPANASGAAGPWAVEALRRARIDETGIASVEDGELLYQVFNAPLRLYVVGAVRIAAALIEAARLLGFEAILVDPRAERMGAMAC